MMNHWEIKSFEALSNLELFRMLQLRTDIFVVEQSCAYPELDESDLSCEHLLLKVDHKIVGTARIFPVQDEKSKIGRVCIHPSYRDQKLGYPLMEKAIQHIQEKGGKQIDISAQTHLAAFYQKLGFKSTSNSYLEDGIPHIDMRLILKQ